MYAGISLESDAVPLTCLYVEQVEPAGLTARYNAAVQWFRDINPWVIDFVLGTVFTAIGLFSLFSPDDPRHLYRQADALGLVLTLGCMAPLYFRRHAPLAVHLIATVSLTFLATLEYPANSESQVLLLTSYALGAYCVARERAIGLGVLLIGLFVVAVVGIPDSSTTNIILSGGFFLAAYFFGTAMQNRRLYAQQMEERATLLERERDEEAQRAVAEERLRIAQELHDVVAHSMGVIAVQAGVGAHVIDQDPAEAKRSLLAISHTSRSTLAEIRRMLGVLREDEGAEYTPAPGLADLERLVRDVRGAGVEVNVEFAGIRTELPPGVDFTAYRIVQEALTNVLKHAGPSRASVMIGYEPDALAVEVTDDGRGVNGRATEGGHGLMGMRERVSVYGGTFEAGPRTGGGFRVAVRLPYGEST
jgi:signal transduction histidine kinase